MWVIQSCGGGSRGKMGGVASSGFVNTGRHFTVLELLLETVDVLLFIIRKAYVCRLNLEG